MSITHSKPCGHAHTVAGCLRCWLADNDPRCHHWKEPPRVAPAQCTLVGYPTGQLAECEECGLGRMQKVFLCPNCGKFTSGRRVAGVQHLPLHAFSRDPLPAPAPPPPTPQRRLFPPPEPVAAGWACGVTTVPKRLDSHLRQTLASVAAAGFPTPWLFVDGLMNEDLPVAGATQRTAPARVHGNWFMGLHEMFVRWPLAEFYAVFQDDVMLCRGAREYVERTYPKGGYCCLYTLPQEAQWIKQRDPAARGWHATTQRGKGALAVVFDRSAAIAVLTARHMVMRPVPTEKADQLALEESVERHGLPLRGEGPWYRGQKCVDGGIVEAMKMAQIPEHVHLPSLAQHTGIVSSFSGITHPLADDWRGEEFDALSLLT